MDALKAALPFKSTLVRGDRLRALTLQRSGGKQLRRDYVRLIHERKRLMAGRPTSIRSCTTGVDDADTKDRFRQSTTMSSRNFKQQLPRASDIPQSPIVTAQAAATKADKLYTMEDTDRLESELDVYCDILPDSIICQPLHRASRICEELVDSSSPGYSDFMDHGSKRPQRLSSTSSDLLD